MASAKSEARKLLGKEEDYIDLKGLNKERDIANQIYNTNKASYENAYNDLLSTLASNRTDARTEFGKGRSTVSENAFMKNREASSDLASRGLSGGIGELSKLGTRMETGRQYSDLANSFYRTMSDIDTRQATGERDYNLGLETAKNELSSALAGIGAREAAARNNYKAQVAQLAEQIQARREAAAQAAAMLAQQRKQYKNEAMNSLNARLSEIAGSNVTEDSYKAAMKYYKDVMGGTDADAVKYLTGRGIGWGTGRTGVVGPTQPWVAPKTKTSTSSKKTNTLSNTIAKATAGINRTKLLSNYLTNTFNELWR